MRDAEIRGAAVPQAKASGVLGNEHDVFRAHGHGDIDPLVGIEVNGVDAGKRDLVRVGFARL